MNNKLRVVCDTNIFVSSFIRSNTAISTTMRYVFQHGYFLFSEETARELHEVFLRPKFDRYVAREKRERLFAEIMRFSEVVTVMEHTDICRDPHDNMFLDVAHDAHTDYLITGDDDLLTLEVFCGVSIVRPTDFLQRVGV